MMNQQIHRTIGSKIKNIQIIRHGKNFNRKKPSALQRTSKKECMGTLPEMQSFPLHRIWGQAPQDRLVQPGNRTSSVEGPVRNLRGIPSDPRERLQHITMTCTLSGTCTLSSRETHVIVVHCRVCLFSKHFTHKKILRNCRLYIKTCHA